LRREGVAVGATEGLGVAMEAVGEAKGLGLAEGVAAGAGVAETKGTDVGEGPISWAKADAAARKPSI